MARMRNISQLASGNLEFVVGGSKLVKIFLVIIIAFSLYFNVFGVLEWDLILKGYIMTPIIIIIGAIWFYTNPIIVRISSSKDQISIQ